MVPKFSGNKSCKNQESSFGYWLKVILPFSNERGKMLICHEIINAFYGSGVIVQNRMFFFLYTQVHETTSFVQSCE